MAILSEKAPYMLTLVFTAIGWITNQMWLDMTNSPIIEAEKHNLYSENGMVGFTITNLSRIESFDNLTFKIRISDDSTAKCKGQPLLVPIPPTDLGYSQNIERPRPECESSNYAEYHISKIHPGGSVELFIKVTEQVDPELFINSNKPVRLMAASFETYLVKNRFSVLIWLLAIWCVLIFMYLIYERLKES